MLCKEIWMSVRFTLWTTLPDRNISRWLRCDRLPNLERHPILCTCPCRCHRRNPVAPCHRTWTETEMDAEMKKRLHGIVVHSLVRPGKVTRFCSGRKPVESVPANFLSDLVGSNQYARVYCGDTCSGETTERTNKEKNTKLVEGRVEMTGRGELWHTKGYGLLWSYLQLHNYCMEWGYASSQRLMPPVVNRQSTETNKGSRQLVLSRFPGICSQNVWLFIH